MSQPAACGFHMYTTIGSNKYADCFTVTGTPRFEAYWFSTGIYSLAILTTGYMATPAHTIGDCQERWTLIGAKDGHTMQFFH